MYLIIPRVTIVELDEGTDVTAVGLMSSDSLTSGKMLQTNDISKEFMENLRISRWHALPNNRSCNFWLFPPSPSSENCKQMKAKWHDKLTQKKLEFLLKWLMSWEMLTQFFQPMTLVPTIVTCANTAVLIWVCGFISENGSTGCALHYLSFNNDIISYHIISYHIISYHIISYHIISYHITSHVIYHTSYIITHII